MSQTIKHAVIRFPAFAICRPSLAHVLWTMLLVTLLALLFVWSRLQAITLEYQLADLDRDLRQKQKLVRQLEVEQNYLASPQRLRRLARESFDLYPLDNAQIRRMP